MTNDIFTHAAHSALVRNWRAPSFSPHEVDWEEGKTFTLRSPREGFLIQVSFSTYPDHPDYIRVRSTNWRAEYEPNAVYKAEATRAFYTQLRRAGFKTPVEMDALEAARAE